MSAIRKSGLSRELPLLAVRGQSSANDARPVTTGNVLPAGSIMPDSNFRPRRAIGCAANASYA